MNSFAVSLYTFVPDSKFIYIFFCVEESQNSRTLSDCSLRVSIKFTNSACPLPPEVMNEEEINLNTPRTLIPTRQE